MCRTQIRILSCFCGGQTLQRFPSFWWDTFVIQSSVFSFCYQLFGSEIEMSHYNFPVKLFPYATCSRNERLKKNTWPYGKSFGYRRK